ncbi:flagellar export protein FliJ [Desulfolithobacter sp.]
MKPFSMEPVLKYRQQREDRARQRFIAAQKEEASQRQELERVEEVLRSLFGELEKERRRGTTPDMLALFENRIHLVQEDIKKLKQEVRAATERVNRERKRLVKAQQERKVLEKLKEHQNRAYQGYLKKKEAALLDEIAVLFHEREQG